MLSLLLGLALSIGTAVLALRLYRSRRKLVESGFQLADSSPYAQARSLLWSGCWLLIKSRDLLAVQAALGLHDPKPCSLLEGLAGDEPLFIAPPVEGWVLVTGTGVPDPCQDPDACFRFVLELSRKLGTVQLFSACRLLHHHAWIKAKRGRVVRAYAWAGKTLWNQGPKTREEKQLQLKCYDYTEPARKDTQGVPEGVATNAERVPLLAARWSFDPARFYKHLLQKQCGISGLP